MNIENRIKLFGMSHALVERDLDQVEQNLRLDLKRELIEIKDDEYYPQFKTAFRDEAKEMAKHYELFYCLEKSIRELIAETLKDSNKENWWDECIPDTIKKSVKDNMKREIDSGITLRSEEEIDYTTFGELGEIVRKNWSDFDAIFKSPKAFSKIMTNLNNLRGPIAHSSLYAEDEIVRLQLTVRDWFRLME